MRYRTRSEELAHRQAMQAIVDRWVDGVGEFDGLSQQAALDRKRQLVAEEIEFYSGREIHQAPLTEDEYESADLWWKRESA